MSNHNAWTNWSACACGEYCYSVRSANKTTENLKRNFRMAIEVARTSQ